MQNLPKTTFKKGLLILAVFYTYSLGAQGAMTASVSLNESSARAIARTSVDTNQPTTPLLKVLKRLYQEKSIYFLFTDPSIGATLVPDPDYSKLPDYILDELTKYSGLEYKKVAENTFVIKVASKARGGAEVADEKLYKLDQLLADEITIKGKVFNAKDNSPLENVSVKIVGTKKGTATKADGSFTITLEKGQVLEFSSVNMVSKSLKVSEAKELQIFLQEADNSLSEVLVLAYGNQKRTTFTGAAVVLTP